MWCRWGTTFAAAVTFGLTAGLVSYEVTAVAQTQNYYYTPSQFRAFLRGFGYKIPQTGGTATTQATQKAISDFQRRYGIKPIDGVAGEATQKVAAEAMKNLQGSLNLVVKPNPPLPRSRFFTPQTAAAIKQFQQQANLPVTGIATLEVRSRLDQEAKKVLEGTSSPSTTPSSSPSTTPSESPSSSPLTTPSPSASPSSSPLTIPSESPSSSPLTTPSPSASPSSSP
ncbi:MAG: peptidoglycan-binding protein [Chroococcidiopsidaceae cyanobacterium CP_BM_ER_R8_30]|nr:peptidoglycan-binding protein [Chroococcidiopsidaceae cyanobacterium CP_BM_ER_R8_30]